MFVLERQMDEAMRTVVGDQRRSFLSRSSPALLSQIVVVPGSDLVLIVLIVLMFDYEIVRLQHRIFASPMLALRSSGNLEWLVQLWALGMSEWRARS